MAKRKFRTYEFQPLNPEKYTGGTVPVILKSSWELEFAQHCDLLPSVISWGYEMVEIPYRDPITGRQKIYIPDFFVKIAQKDGYTQDHVFEIKPMHEQLQEHARNQADSALVARNAAKWGAATAWADRHSAVFSVLNEKDIYGWHDARKPVTNQVKAFAPTHATKPNAGPKAPKAKSNRAKVASSNISRMKNRLKTPRVTRTRRVKRA